ncbi:3'(2'),5'-bisphosphate nucleotidase [Pasteurellaceae bacterium RH1A]|nr:3'(2'),5'-bisphosphate nucleotidase [Pasteurellaceae bacterium RH1A]
MQTLNSSLLQAVLDLAHQAGQHLTNFYAQSVAVHIKADQTPVTEADLFISQFVVEQLKALTPEVPVLSEESCKIPLSERQNWQEYWIVDPLDGTQQFIDRTDQFAVVIGLVQNNRPVLGVIHAPILGKTYYALAGAGAFLQEKGQIRPLVRRATQPKEQFLIAMGTPNPQRIAASLQAPYQAELMKYGSSSLKAGLVAEGKADCYIRFGDTGEWDTAVAEVLLAETGGQIFDLNFQPLTYNQRESFINPHFVMVANKAQDWQAVFDFY